MFTAILCGIVIVILVICAWGAFDNGDMVVGFILIIAIGFFIWAGYSQIIEEKEMEIRLEERIQREKTDGIAEIYISLKSQGDIRWEFDAEDLEKNKELLSQEGMIEVDGRTFHSTKINYFKVIQDY